MKPDNIKTEVTSMEYVGLVFIGAVILTDVIRRVRQ